MASTNAGFCQANMTWCDTVHRPNYHWVIDLHERTKLPVVPSIVQALQKATAERATEEYKRQRIHMRVAREVIKKMA